MKFKKIICLLITVVLAFSAVSGKTVAFAINASYLDGVTEAEIEKAYSGTKKLLSFVMEDYLKTDLGEMLEPMIYNDAVVSELFVSVYMSMEASAENLKMLGIDATVKGVSEKLSAYPEVQKILSETDNFQNIDKTKLVWGVTDKASFAKAVSVALSPLNDLFNMLLCSGEFTIQKIIKIKGGDGYTTAVLPILKALGCSDIPTQEDLTQQANEDKNSIIYNIIISALSIVDKLKEDPLETLVTVLPSFAYFCESGQLNEGLSTLLTPIKENSFVQFAVKLELVEFQDITFDVEAMINDGIKTMSAENNLVLSPVDFELLSSWGNVENGVYTPDKYTAFIGIMTWLADMLKQNKEAISTMLPASGEALSLLPDDILDSVLSKETDVILKTYISLFNETKKSAPVPYIYSAVTFSQVTYTPNLTKENFDKVADGIDDLVNEFITEYSDYSKLGYILEDSIYTNSNISMLVTGVYSMLEKEGLLEALALLGVDATPKGVSKLLTEGDYKAVRAVLSKASSWSKVNLEGVSWGFKTGGRKGFENALVASLRPLYPVLEIMLQGKPVSLLDDTIVINGGDGYNTAIIPVLEALGCESKNIKTYEEYVKDDTKDAILKNITTPVFDLLDDIFDKPVDTVLEKLPNILYFIDNGNLDVCINNLMLPLVAVIEKIEPLYKIEMEVPSVTGALNVNELLSSVGGSMGIKLKEADLKVLYSFGETQTKTSKQLINGENPTYTYIKPDKTALLITVLRYFVDVLKMPENSAVLTESMSGGGADSFALYASQIFAQFETMTTDEIIEWLYNLLFKERVIVPLPEGETYSPTIIYEETPKDYKAYYIIGGVAAFEVIAGIVFYLCRKKLYY